jgi:hypothetical protein
VSSTPIAGVGQYGVIFDRDVTECAYNATVGTPTNFGSVNDPVTISTARRTGNPNGVFVKILNVSGAGQAEPFHLKVTC